MKKQMKMPLLWIYGLAVLVILIMLTILLKLLSLYEGVQILLTFTLVLVTAEYAKSSAMQVKATSETTKEMRDSRFASFQPIIVMGRAPAYGVIKDAIQISEQTTISDRIWLYNVGPGPALNLRFFLKEPNRKNPTGTFSGRELRALGQGEAYELMIENVFGQKRLSSHDLVVEYEDVFGEKWRSGLELNYTSGADCFTVIELFYEKMSEQKRGQVSRLAT